MECKYIGKIEKFYGNKLSNQEITIINKHLETCNICSDFLKELEYSDQFIAQMKLVKPDLPNPVSFRREVLSKIKLKPRMVFRNDIRHMIDVIIYILVQPATRFAFISAAILFFGLFVYQQSMIIQKIGTLEKRMETNMDIRDSQKFNRLDIEALFKVRKEENVGEEEIEDVLNDYRILQVKYRILIKVLKDKHPETYRELLKIIDEEKSSFANNNI
ncbi:MAG: hypothetical protein KAI29_25205 [Cyclobacteriaceae bacterium]|nr:hypothetical protein [Cyclobacteriaceae bacterium]